MKTLTIYYAICIIALVIIGGYILLQTTKINTTTSTGETTITGQNIKLSWKNYNYYPQVIKVKVGMPVSISLDGTIRGCYRSFTIRALGLQKYLATPQDTLEFTPTQKGTYTFACAMGMGTGTLIVE